MIYSLLLEKSTETAVEEFVQNPGIVRTYLEKYMPSVIGFLIQLLIAIIILLIGSKIIKSIDKLIRKRMEKGHIDQGVATFLASLLKYVLYFILIMIILSQFGVTTGSVVAVLGSAGLTVGLALQGSLSNFAGGVLILVLKPFSIGDYIIVGANEGAVTDISLFYTKLNTIDNKVIMIPNGGLADSSIVNVSMMDKRRLDIYVGISYDSDIKKAKEILTKLVSEQPEILKDEPMDVFVNALSDSSVDMGLRVWVKNEDYWKLKWRILELIKEAFDKNNIRIPFPQVDVNISK